MAPSPKKPGPQAYPAQLSLQQQLKNCLVNLPSALVTVLVDANTAAQNVVVELSFHPAAQKLSSKTEGRTAQKSVYMGWTGFQSQSKLASVVSKEGLSGARGNAAVKDREVSVLEIDSTFAQLLGLSDGLKVGVLLHLDPPQAHTINIEPLSPADWEIIELHANFLELHMLSQIRALPNPNYKTAGAPSQHPLTLHLSPTSTASILVTSLEPAPPNTSPFVKISPDAEVIVAPKTRSKSLQSVGKGDRSVKSGGGKSATSTVRNRSSRIESSRKVTYLRGIGRNIADEWFDSEKPEDKNEGLKVWVGREILSSKPMKGITWVWVSILRPAGLQAPLDPQQQAQQNTEDQDVINPASRVVARLCAWEDAPNSSHVAISSTLCRLLDSEGIVGETIRLEPAPPQVTKSAVKTFRVFPFAVKSDKQKDGFKFGGKSNADREEAVRKIMTIFGQWPRGNGLFEGPLTDGMLLPGSRDEEDGSGWAGGILKIEPPPGPPVDPAKSTRGWILGSEKKVTVDLMAELTIPSSIGKTWAVGESMPSDVPMMVGIDAVTGQLYAHMTHFSSVLLTGGLGSGKTALSQLVGHRLRADTFCHVTYFPCRTLVTDETRISTIKDSLTRAFALAVWGARSGGRAVVILDDLDKLCPVETELQVGGENSRSRHISEIFISIVRQYCSRDKRVVLLATAQSKDAVNNVIIGGHVVREILNLNAPDKEARRKILGLLLDEGGSTTSSKTLNGLQTPEPEPEPELGEEKGWLDGSSLGSIPNSPLNGRSRNKFNRNTSTMANRFVVDPDIDLLDIAGQSDGFMPGDLLLLVSRARSEALIRNMSSLVGQNASSMLLMSSDFSAALKGFTPASLRNVTLQHSTTTFSSIGGLKDTRRTLLETLQYPTTYAPIFARCPLRLRSGLLLYGYPGCGKTLLASAVAGECGLNFISVKGPEILNKYIGASEKSVRDLFERAQAARPCVLFFDEFDSVAPKRGHDSTGVTDRVVNQLLTQMDGAEGLSGVYVLAATSRPDLIDPALLRPGRLDKSLLCDMPSADDREDILQAVSKKLRVNPHIMSNDTTKSSGENLVEIAQRTEGYSGADLQAVMYNAHLEAIHDVLSDKSSGSRSREPNETSKGHTGGAAEVDFSYFRFGEEPNGEAPLSAAARATERSQIAAKLVIHQKAAAKQHQRQRMSRRFSTTSQDDSDDRQKHEKRGTQEPVIEWTHIEKSLAQTRPSISAEERRRLAGIYREFIVGRNGEMPSGQGGNEIGGRSSLM